MAMARAPGTMSGQVMEVPYCPICIEPYKKPKVLPCGHTFCLPCIIQVGQDKRPGDILTCPQCRTEFSIPWGGFGDLANNYIILQSTPIAMSSAEVKYCIQHPLKEIEFFCYDCKTTACVVCYKQNHMKHKCSDVKEWDGQGAIADQEIVGPDFSSSFFQPIPVVHQIPDQANRRPIHGIVSVNSRVFVVRNETEHIQLYDANDLTKAPIEKKLGRHQLRFPRIVACPNYCCVFVSTVIDAQSYSSGAINAPSSVIYRTAISLVGTIVEWHVKGRCSGLSMTNNDHLLVTLSSERLIEECTRDGKFIREISLDHLPPPLHCVQLPSGRFAVSHGGPMPQKQISIMTARGTVLHQILQPFLGSEGSTVVEFEDPGQLAVDKHNRLFVVDCSSNLIQLLDPTLTHLGYFHISGCEIQQAFALHLDESGYRRLYVGELNGRLLVFGAPFIPTNSTNNGH